MDARPTIDPTFPSAHALGYVDLVPLLAGTKRPVFKNWQNYNATTADLAEWQAAGYSLGHRSGASKCGGQNIVALDADALDEKLAAVIRSTIREVTGLADKDLVVRVGQAPKAMYVFRMIDTTPIVASTVTFADPVAKRDQDFQVRGDGMQFVMRGIHPDTQRPYQWNRFPPAADLPTITQQQINRIRELLLQRLPAAQEIGGGGTTAVNQAELEGDTEQVRKAVASIPNSSKARIVWPDRTITTGMNRTVWVRIIYAIKAATGDNADGLSITHEFSDRWQDGAANDEETEKTFDSAKPPFRAGASWLYELAEANDPNFKAQDAKAFDFVSRWFDYAAAARAAQSAPYTSPFANSGGGASAYDMSDPNRRLRPIPWDEAVEQAATDTTQPLVKGLLDQGAMSVVYGASGAGKTFICMEVGHCVATGRDFAGKKVTKGAIVYVAAEGGRRAKRRLWALQTRYNSKGIPFYIIASSIDLRLPDADTGPLLKEIAALGVPVVLIVIDTLARALAGGDENSVVDMGFIIKHGDAIRKVTGAHLMFVHHTGKDQAKGARGHSSLKAATDTEVEIAPGSIEVTKQRDGETGWSATFKLDSLTLGFDADQEPITSCVVAKLTPAAKSSKGEPIAKMVVDALRTAFPHGASKADLEIFLQLDRKDKANLRATLPRLVQQGRIEVRKSLFFYVSNVMD